MNPGELRHRGRVKLVTEVGAGLHIGVQGRWADGGCDCQGGIREGEMSNASHEATWQFQRN